jgi:hypothetical protein
MDLIMPIPVLNCHNVLEVALSCGQSLHVILLLRLAANVGDALERSHHLEVEEVHLVASDEVAAVLRMHEFLIALAAHFVVPGLELQVFIDLVEEIEMAEVGVSIRWADMVKREARFGLCGADCRAC